QLAIVARRDQRRQSLQRTHGREYVEESGYPRHAPASRANHSCTGRKLSPLLPHRPAGRQGPEHLRLLVERQKNRKEERASEINVVDIRDRCSRVSPYAIIVEG